MNISLLWVLMCGDTNVAIMLRSSKKRPSYGVGGGGGGGGVGGTTGVDGGGSGVGSGASVGGGGGGCVG